MSFTDTLPEEPGLERARLILEAVRAGQGQLTWGELHVSDETNKLTIYASYQVLKIDGTRIAVMARTQQLIADHYEAVMPTARISDLVYKQAVYKLGPETQTPGSRMAYTSRFVLHSERIDKQLEEGNEPPLRGDDGLSVEAFCAPEGKDWVLCRRLWQKPGYAANYGWQAPGYPNPGVTPGVTVIQPLELGHFMTHVDYSQFCRLVKRKCVLNGAEVDIADILTDVRYAHLLSHEGPLPGVRHPGVPDATSLPNVVFVLESQAWRDPTKTLGERALAFSANEKERGVKEKPPRSNTGPEIAEYFGPAKRRSSSGVEYRLGITKGNWCCVSACAAMKASLLDGEVAPHGYRAGVVEAVRDAMERGTWMGVELVRGRERVVHIGDLAVFDRSVPGRPETSWWRHVARVSVIPSVGGDFRTLGGNESDQYLDTPRRLDSPKLLGFIAYPRLAPIEVDALNDGGSATVVHTSPLGVPADVSHLIEISDAVTRGEFGLAHVFADFEDPDHGD